MSIDEANKPKGELHKVDKILFDAHPSPVWEAMMRLHRSHVNSTTPCFGPLLYWWIRAIGAAKVMEIGIAQGYTSWFMAEAVKDNGIRYGFKGKYIAVDIADKTPLFQPSIDDGLPIEVWTMDSKDIIIGAEDKPGVLAAGTYDLIFQDGWHNTKHCLKELEYIYPALKSKGDGYMVAHDVYSWCEEYYKIITTDPKYKWETIRLMNNYGLAIMRKMDDYDYTKVHWPQGDQPEADGYVR